MIFFISTVLRCYPNFIN